MASLRSRISNMNTDSLTPIFTHDTFSAFFTSFMRERQIMKVKKAMKLALFFVFVIFGIAGVQPNSEAVTKHKVVWQSKVGEEFQVFMTDLDNPAAPTQLTNGQYGSKHPTIMNSVKRVYYYHFFPTAWGEGDQVFYRDLPDGKEYLVQRNAIHSEIDPCVSRNGNMLTYCSRQSLLGEYESENWEICLLKTDFSEEKRITHEIHDDLDPFVTADGSHVYFTIEIIEDKTETEKKELRDAAKEKNEKLDEESDEFLKKKLYYIYKNTFAGDSLERITPRDYSAWHPSISANEQWMVFASNMDGNDEIYLMDLSTFEITRLTQSDGYDGKPCISSDGDVIVFVSDRDGDKEIFSMNRFGKNLVQLTENDVEDDSPFIT